VNISYIHWCVKKSKDLSSKMAKFAIEQVTLKIRYAYAGRHDLERERSSAD
jgi:hypothetical protein